MLDIKYVRNNPKRVKDNICKRGMSHDSDVDILLEVDAAWRLNQSKLDNLRYKLKELSNRIRILRNTDEEAAHGYCGVTKKGS